MNILVGSENPVKLNSTKEAFSKYFGNVNVTGIAVKSNVPDQPVNEDTFTGAKNRALELIKYAEENNVAADFFVGIEGGIINYYNRWFAFGCMFISDNKGKEGFGTSPHFELPEKVVNLVLSGKELGEVIDSFTGVPDTKHKEGAIGFFTNGIMSRKELYLSGLITALIPFAGPEI